MKNYFLKSVLVAAMLLLHVLASAEDTDLFVNPAAVTNSDVPNVLLVIDNTANWNSAFTNEIAALVATFNNLPDSKFRVGIMFAVETGNPNNNIDGGYVRAALRLIDGTTRPKYTALINSFDKLGDKGNGGSSSLQMAEAYLYFSGGAPYAGKGKAKTDYTGNVSGTAASNAIYALAGFLLLILVKNIYLATLAVVQHQHVEQQQHRQGGQ